MTLDRSTLQAALIGYESERERVSGKIAEIQRALGSAGRKASGDAAPRKRRTMSAAAKKRIAAAQKARWAAYRRAKKA